MGGDVTIYSKYRFNVSERSEDELWSYSGRGIDRSSDGIICNWATIRRRYFIGRCGWLPADCWGVGQLVFAIKARAGNFSIILAILTVLACSYMVGNSGVFEVIMGLQLIPIKG